MGAIRSSKVNDHALIVQWSNNSKRKEKKPKSGNEDESLNPTDEVSMKKVKKKGNTFKCSYFRKGFHAKNKCFKKNMNIMSQLLEKHNIEAPDELENPVESSKHYHSA